MNAFSGDVDEMFESLSRYFALLSDPTRIRILHTLCGQEISVNEIVARVGASQTNVSRHLRTLYDAGVIKRRKSGNFAFYRISDTTLADICRVVLVQIDGRNDAAGKTDGAMSLAESFWRARPAPTN